MVDADDDDVENVLRNVSLCIIAGMGHDDADYSIMLLIYCCIGSRRRLLQSGTHVVYLT